MVAAFNSSFKTKALKQINQIIKSNVLIASASQNLVKNFFQLAHWCYSVIPDSFATVLMSLSPRPERFTRMI